MTGFASTYARRVIEDLGIRDPQDLKYLDLVAWRRGAMVIEKPLQGAEARLTAIGGQAIIIISSTLSDPRRKRFSIAHELGHLEMHKDAQSLILCAESDIGYFKREKMEEEEKEANEFASALLLPASMLSRIIQDKSPSITLISQIADEFDVSLTAAALRFINLSKEPLAVACSKAGVVEWCISNDHLRNLGLFMRCPAKLDEGTCAAEFFKTKGKRQSSGHVSVHSWFENGRYSEEAEIMEDSLFMPNYNSALTLLWADKEL